MKRILKIFLIIISMIFIFNSNTLMVSAEVTENSSIIVEESFSNEEHLLNTENLSSCDSILGEPTDDDTPAYYLSFVFSVMRYAAIIILIVMTIMDFTSAITSQDNDIMRKSISKLGKRAVMCVVIFVLPTLIDLVLQFLHQSQISDCIDLNQ